MRTDQDLRQQIAALLKVEGTGYRLIRLDEEGSYDAETDAPIAAPWEFADPAGYYATGGNGLVDLRDALNYVVWLVEWRLRNPEDYDDDSRVTTALCERLGAFPKPGTPEYIAPEWVAKLAALQFTKAKARKRTRRTPLQVAKQRELKFIVLRDKEA